MILPSIVVSVVAFAPSYAVQKILAQGILPTIAVCCVSVISVIIASYYIGMNKREREAINRMFLKKLKINKK